MAENKKSVILYTDLIHTFEELTDTQAGRLIKHFLRYVNDKNPVAPDKFTKILFEPIKQQLKRDLQKWDTIRGKRSEAGKVSAELRKQQKSTNSTSVESVQQTSTNSTVNVNDNVNVIDSGPTQVYTIEHCIVLALNDERWARVNKATEYSLKEFNRFLEGQGVYKKNPADYKQHYHNWKKKVGHAESLAPTTGGPKLPTL